MSARSRRQSRTRSFGDPHVWDPADHNAWVRRGKDSRRRRRAALVAAAWCRRLGLPLTPWQVLVLERTIRVPR